ncbi:response regulator transcription factor [Alloscardovia theropitheci]|uniref:Response regulator transcription factor n=1 Tax=Alloscardovia theropitheci TaxID=2496842 RepID=A0A4R0QZI0_9BIFI|nr:LytTR family DNA-binding domain-containing protein [Alloscardovia theropitheci]TCD54046.1 response regulator transcription factor [Alloscardovia theropitheci]
MRIAIIDDVAIEREQTRALVEKTYKDEATHKYGSVAIQEFSSGSEFLEKYPHGHDYDVIFLDIEMPGIDGMETARKIREVDNRTIIIFTTRMAQYAVAGYTVDATGYLVKPISQSEYELAWRKVKRIMNSRDTSRITIESTAGTVFINTADIVYLDVRSHMLFYHTTNGTYTAWKSLTAAAKELDEHNFVQISRFVMINCAYVNKIDTVKADIEIRGEIFHVSRSKKREVFQKLLDFHSRA